MDQDKNMAYYGHARREIESALPEHCGRVLEVGCGAGATLQWLGARPGTTHTTGIEVVEAAARQAELVADEVYCLDFEHAKPPVPLPPFDTILCLDVLEHMVDPWAALDRLVTQYLRPQGTIVATLPNVRHHTVVLPLLFQGKWQYQDAGILDRTHLRFFSRDSALALLAHADLAAVQCTPLSFAENRWKRIVNRSTFRVFEGLLTPQYLLSARKQPGRHGHGG